MHSQEQGRGCRRPETSSAAWAGEQQVSANVGMAPVLNVLDNPVAVVAAVGCCRSEQVSLAPDVTLLAPVEHCFLAQLLHRVELARVLLFDERDDAERA